MASRNEHRVKVPRFARDDTIFFIDASSQRTPVNSTKLSSRAQRGTFTLLVLAAALSCWAGAVLAQSVAGDAIAASLTGAPGDAARGRAIVANRQVGLCLLCHTAPIAEERFQGNLAPSLAGAGSRWSEGQLRLRIVDAARLNADTIMPPYYRTGGLQRVARSFSGKTVLTAGQIEDVVAYLVSLKD
jgi:sulfur-oxidizing protein SoxX